MWQTGKATQKTNLMLVFWTSSFKKRISNFWCFLYLRDSDIWIISYLILAYNDIHVLMQWHNQHCEGFWFALYILQNAHQF